MPQASSLEGKRKKGGGKAGKSERKLLFLKAHVSIFLNLFILFLAVLGLRYCEGFSLIEASRGYFSAMMCGLLIVVASLVAEHGF